MDDTPRASADATQLAMLASAPVDVARASTLCLLMLIALLLALPLATLPLAPEPRVAVVFGWGVGLCGVASSIMLLRAGRSAGTRVLAAAFLYDGVLGLVHVLASPGVLGGPRAVAGEVDRTGWEFLVWQVGFGALLLTAVSIEASRHALWRAVFIGAAAAAACGVAVAIGQSGLLPTAVKNVVGLWDRAGCYAALGIFAVTASLIWVTGLTQRLLYLWLAAFVTANAVGLALGSIGAARYTLGWYGARLFELAAALAMTAALLRRARRPAARE